ncbi:non-ribosomal peptide synthetase [Streptomyces sp. NRRL B-24484]|uniref:non-ribosomal peptide synthetase n=1 Tax=Streptomyces sp. NRRL B-24484 TaxID=1463833 RepID=UPI00069458AC|nr:non-ribosomal peptide synthetase [Streptomyces sp. NRRL B-24484]
MSELINRLAKLPGERRAAFLAQLRGAGARPQTELRPREDRERPVPLSFAQAPLWFLDRLAPGLATYNVTTAYRLDGPLDTDALARALAGVVDRHEALRTRVRETPDGPVQEIAGHQFVDLAPLPAEGASPDERESWAERFAEEFARRPFDLETGPLWRAALLRSEPERHLLVLAVHHIVCDGWSLGVVARELAAGYAGEAVAPPPVQYADHTLWQRARLTGPELARLTGFWRERLAGLPTVDLPTDRPRPPEVRYEGAHRSRLLPAELAPRVRELARSEGTTPYTVLLTAFLLLLRRYSGQHDLVVGSPTANRDRVEIEDLVGFFVNTLPIRVDLDGEPTGREALARVSAAVRDSFAHGELPFEQIVDAARPPRDPSRSPLVQLAFTYQNADRPLQLTGLTVDQYAVGPGTSRFDMSWNATERADGLDLYVEYATALFDPATVDRMTTHYGTLLDALLADPGAEAGRLPLLSAEEQAELTGGTFDGARRPVPAGTLATAFAEQAARTPDAVALAVSGRDTSYAELDSAAAELADLLRAAGARPGERVALLLPRSEELLTAVLAVLCTGAAYVPLDAANPPARIAAVLADATPVAVLATDTTEHGLPTGSPARRIVHRDGRWHPEGGALVALSESGGEAGPDDTAYVIYTSGTTGTPKGVPITHRSAVAFADSVRRLFELTADDRVLGFASAAFDVSVFETFAALLTGARLCLATDEERLDPARLQELMERQSVTVVDLPPSVMALLEPERLPALRIVFVGGEAFSGELVNRWNPGRRFFNGYGPTECTVTMIVQECAGHWTASPPIGLPMDNHVAHVLDGHLQPVPYGVPGELVIGGAGLTPGYLNTPDLTAEKIVADPFGTAPGGRLYRTGDLVRREPGGAITFLGRIDQQVKLRGLRIELGEVEAALAAVPGIGQTAAAVWTDPLGERHLVVYTAPADGAEPAEPAALRAALAERLPGWMLPAHYVALPVLPLTTSGKVDRRALPEPDPAARPRGGPATAPRTETERILAEEVFAEVLGTDGVCVHDSFFDLGGTSLRSTRLLARIRERFGVEVPLAEFFRGPTVEHLAALVDRARATALDDDALIGLIERMSEDEAARLLAGGGPAS